MMTRSIMHKAGCNGKDEGFCDGCAQDNARMEERNNALEFCARIAEDSWDFPEQTMRTKDHAGVIARQIRSHIRVDR